MKVGLYSEPIPRIILNTSCWYYSKTRTVRGTKDVNDIGFNNVSCQQVMADRDWVFDIYTVIPCSENDLLNFKSKIIDIIQNYECEYNAEVKHGKSSCFLNRNTIIAIHLSDQTRASMQSSIRESYDQMIARIEILN